MGVGDWFRKLFSPSKGGPSDDYAVLPEERGEPSSGGIDDAGLQRIRAQRGATGFAGLETAEAAEDAIEGADDPAP
jgi:hypothetical protein